jgi:hypothetical protein
LDSVANVAKVSDSAAASNVNVTIDLLNSFEDGSDLSDKSRRASSRQHIEPSRYAPEGE